MFTSFAKNSALYVISASLFLLFYALASILWVPIGGTGLHILYIEFPLISILLGALYFPEINSKTIRYTLPIVPILILYLSFDLLYAFLNRALRPSDIQNFSTIYDVSPLLGILGMLVILLIPASVLITIYAASKQSKQKKFIFSVTVRCLAILGTVLFVRTDSFATFQSALFNQTNTSHERSIRRNGRLSSFIFYGIQENANRRALRALKTEIDVNEVLYPDTIINKRNVHVIVLESFVDPRLILDPKMNPSPLHNNLVPYLNPADASFSTVISPVYGGGTVQAEIELLTGVAGLAQVASIDFNIMEGAPTAGFTNSLHQEGYYTIATIATGSGYFNSTLAYRSVGFDSVTFLEEEVSFHKSAGDMVIFDGDGFDFNLALLKDRIATTDKPVLNYFLGMYGHIPYDRNLSIRPDSILSTHSDARVQKIANQFFYRTKALAKHIRALLEIDPTGLIYVTSDHLPAILGDDIRYKHDRFSNIALLIDTDKFVDVSEKHHYEIPWKLWDILTETEHARDISPIKMEALYYKLLFQTLKQN